MEKVQNKKGFTLLEVMIVVAIIGILATVCIPLYMAYIHKSRVKSLVYPGLRAIENNIALYFASTSKMPDASLLNAMIEEADTTYFNVNIVSNELVITIDSPLSDSKLFKLNDMPMYLQPKTHEMRIATWELRGTLARYLGISTEGN